MITLKLLLAHMIADYALQTGRIAEEKAKGWKGLFRHLAIVVLASGFLTAGQFPYWAAWILLLGVLHLLIDQYRTFYIRDLSPARSLAYFVLDQTLHLVTLMVVALAGAGETPARVWAVLSQRPCVEGYWVMWGIWGIFLIWTAAVLEMEVLKAVSYRCQIQPPRRIDPLDRLFGASERLVATALYLARLGPLFPVAFLPRLYWAVRWPRPGVSRRAQLVTTLVSALCALAAAVVLDHMLPQ